MSASAIAVTASGPVHTRWRRFGSDSAILALLAAVAFTLYFDAAPSIPHSDEFAFALERKLFPNNWDWFWHLVSYSRSRIIAPGDSLLFRPLHMTVLAFIDIFAPHGARLASIGMLTIAAFSLYVFVRSVTDEWVGIAAAILFAIEYPGSVIVTYHHISPYLLSLAFLGFGLASMTKHQTLVPIVCFSVAALFHEMIALGLLATLIYVAVFVRDHMRYAAVVLGVPLLAFLTLNVIDASIYGVSFSPGSVGKHYLYALSIPGGFLAAFIYPPIVKLAAMPGYDLPVWSNIPDILPVLYVLSAVLLCAAVAALPAARRSPVALLIGGTLAALMVGFGYGRGVMRGADYVMVATWYNSLAVYLFVALSTCILPQRVVLGGAGLLIVANLIPRLW